MSLCTEGDEGAGEGGEDEGGRRRGREVENSEAGARDHEGCGRLDERGCRLSEAAPCVRGRKRERRRSARACATDGHTDTPDQPQHGRDDMSRLDSGRSLCFPSSGPPSKHWLASHFSEPKTEKLYGLSIVVPRHPHRRATRPGRRVVRQMAQTKRKDDSGAQRSRGGPA